MAAALAEAKRALGGDSARTLWELTERTLDRLEAEGYGKYLPLFEKVKPRP